MTFGGVLHWVWFDYFGGRGCFMWCVLRLVWVGWFGCFRFMMCCLVCFVVIMFWFGVLCIAGVLFVMFVGCVCACSFGFGLLVRVFVWFGWMVACSVGAGCLH